MPSQLPTEHLEVGSRVKIDAHAEHGLEGIIYTDSNILQDVVTTGMMNVAGNLKTSEKVVR